MGIEGVPEPYPGHFVHGISIHNWYPCWNLALAGQLCSPDFAALTDPGLAAAHQPLRTASIDELRTTGISQGMLTPRAIWYLGAAALIRDGGRVGVGTQHTRWLPREAMDSILRLGDIELAFEEVRRRILPNGASRLASLYLADDSESGRAHLREMLGADIVVLRVTVPVALRITQVDSKWFELYCRDPKLEFIETYWSSGPVSSKPVGPVTTWEYLLDGVLEVDDPKAHAYIRNFGAHRSLVRERPAEDGAS